MNERKLDWNREKEIPSREIGMQVLRRRISGDERIRALNGWWTGSVIKLHVQDKCCVAGSVVPMGGVFGFYCIHTIHYFPNQNVNCSCNQHLVILVGVSPVAPDY